MRNSLYILILTAVSVLSFSACEPDWQSGDYSFQPQIVVEGWIDEGLFANVILTQSLVFGNDSDESSNELMDIPIRWAKVSVSDGEDEEILVGRLDDRYFPPFIYTGSRLRGEAGKRYTLTVEYSGRKLTAETTIPESVKIDDIRVEQSEESDTLYSVRISFKDSPTQKNYYKVFTRVKPYDSRYLSSFMGTVSDEMLSADHTGTITVSRALKQLSFDDYTPFFRRGDTVSVKLTQLPEEGFNFWSDYENAITTGNSILFPSNTNIRSNISGGLGIWCGYGTDIRTVIIPE